jgi:hypothetical protein
MREQFLIAAVTAFVLAGPGTDAEARIARLAEAARGTAAAAWTGRAEGGGAAAQTGGVKLTESEPYGSGSSRIPNDRRCIVGT